MNAKRTQAKTLETLTLIEQNGGKLLSGDPVSLRTFNGTHYLRAQGGGGREVNATEDWISMWETFTIGKKIPEKSTSATPSPSGPPTAIS